DVRRACARGVRGEQNAFEHLVRVLFHEDAVIERARLALVGIDAKINRPRVVLGQECPLEPAWKTGTAAAAQAGSLDGVRDLSRRHLVDGAGEGAVTAVG